MSDVQPVNPGHQVFTPEENLDEARRLLLEAGPQLVSWLASEGLTIQQASPEVHWGQLQGRWKHLGRLRALKAWHHAAKESIVAHGVTGRTKVASKLASMFAGAQMEQSADLIRPLAVDAQDMSEWPAEMRYAFRHPLLHFDPGHKTGCCEKCLRPFTNPVMRAMVAEYERENKAPNEAALTLLRRCVDNPKLIDDLLKAQFRPQKALVVDAEDEKEVEEGQRVNKLKERLAESRKRVATMPQ